MLTSRRNSRSGQALIEFIPAILLFFIVIGSSLVFFIGLRESFHMQIAARNAMFAKIRNTGPLISPANSQLTHNEHYMVPLGTTANPAVHQGSTCFTARPQTNVQTVVLPTILGVPLALDRAHRATIFRRPGNYTMCD